MSDINRREYLRVPKKFQVEIAQLAFPLTSQETITVESADISAGGLRIVCNKMFSCDDKVQVKVFIASFNKFHPGFFKALESDVGQYLQAVAKVAWVSNVSGVQRYEIGLEFLDVYEDDWRALRNLVLSQQENTG